MQIDPVAINIFGLSIHWYGLMWLFAAIQFLYFADRFCIYIFGKKNPKLVENLLYAVLIGSLLGGRFGYVFFYGFDRFIADPLWLFKIWQGGMSFFGGLIGVILATIWISKKENYELFKVADLITIATPLGLAFGRLGNFINGELWGRETNLPWGVVFKDAGPEPRHPSQLYEMLGEGVLIFIVLFILMKYYYRTGLLSCVFLIMYAIIRFLVEFVRVPDEHMGLYYNLTIAQWFSIPMLIGGISLLIYLNKKTKFNSRH